MSLEIKQKTKVKISIYGESFELRKPTVEQVEELEKFSTSEKDDKAKKFDSICGYLDMLGLPKDFSKKMEIDHLVQVIKYVSGEMNFDEKKSGAGL